MKQAIAIIIAIITGLLFPALGSFSFLLPYILAGMIFLTIINIHIPFHWITDKRIWMLIAANISIAFLAYWISLFFFTPEIAFLAFFVGITPTATAAPTVLLQLKKNVPFGIVAMISSNLIISLLIPFVLALFSPVQVSSFEILQKTFALLLLPACVVVLLRYFAPAIEQKIIPYKSYSFWLWTALIFISIGKASGFLQTQWAEYGETALLIAAITMVLCLFNFWFGRFLGGSDLSEETSQLLGQKNPSLMIWIALTFFSPLVALGPTFYMIFHNLMNAGKLLLEHKKQ